MILMLFHLFCMIDDFWRMNRSSQDSDGKTVLQMQYSRRSENPRKYMEITIFPEDKGRQKEKWRRATGGPHHPLVWAPWAAPPGGVDTLAHLWHRPLAYLFLPKP